MKTIKINESEVKTQRDAILWHLKTYKSITSWEAIKEYGATRLSAIIFNLRNEGYQIDSHPELVKTRFGRPTKIARYLYILPTPKYNQEELF